MILLALALIAQDGGSAPASAQKAPDPVVAEALHRVEDCYRREVKRASPTMASRRNAYAAAATACVDTRTASAAAIEERWKAREAAGEPASKVSADRYIGYFLIGVQYQIDAEIMGSERR